MRWSGVGLMLGSVLALGACEQEGEAVPNDVGAVVVGLPLTLEGVEDEWCAEVRRVGDALGERLGVPVAYVDERMSSVQAEQAIRSSGGTKKRREDRSRVDAAAAAVTLQRHLDREPAA